VYYVQCESSEFLFLDNRLENTGMGFKIISLKGSHQENLSNDCLIDCLLQE